MKTLTGTIKYALAATGIVVIVACATVMQSKDSGWSIHRSPKTGAENGVEILPGASLSENQYAALTAVLKHYPKSIYKIQIYQHGQALSTIGTLNEQKYMAHTVAEVATTAKKMAFTGSSICAGDCNNDASTHKGIDAKIEELVQKLKPILEKPQQR
jgi:hypothetical protein